MIVKILNKMMGAIRGVYVWKKLTKNYDIKRDNFFMLYPSEENLAQYINQYLYSYMQEKGAMRCVFFVTDVEAGNLIERRFKDNINISVCCISLRQAYSLLDAYWYNVLGDRLMIVSLKNLYGRKIDRLIGRKGITEEDVFAAGLFTLKVQGVRNGNDSKAEWKFRVRT